MRDHSSAVQITQLFPPKAATTDNTAYTSAIIDTALFDSLTLAITLGTLTDADFTTVVAVNEGNQANMSDGSAVAAANLFGSLANFTPNYASSGQTLHIGYGGNKRYIQVVITPSANTGNIFLAGVAIQGQPRTLPTGQQD